MIGTRQIAALLAVGATLLLMLGAITALPPFGAYAGTYGNDIAASVLTDRHVTSAIVAVVFDYRGFDTLGEEFVLLTACTGLVVLLRERRGAARSRAVSTGSRRFTTPRSSALLISSRFLVGLPVVFAVYLVAHGYITPGGGFQGGLLFGTATLLAYIAGNYDVYRDAMVSDRLERLEGIGAALFVGTGLAATLRGLPFLTNFLPFGTKGTLLSGGTIPLLDWAVGIEVAAGFSLLFMEFLEETRQPAPGEED